MPGREENNKGGSGKFIIIENLRKKFNGIIEDKSHKGINITGTALLLEGIHFNLIYFPLEHLGYKAVISSISEIYGKGGIPEVIAVNLGISSRHNIGDIEMIFQGIEFACRNYSLKLSDIYIESSLTGLTLSVTTTGKSSSNFNQGANAGENDLVCITGQLGDAYMGLHILERERKVFEESAGAQPRLEGYEFVIGRQLKPDLPAALLEEVFKTGAGISSLMVSREGLSSDMVSLCRRNSTGCRLYIDRIPVSAEAGRVASELGIEPIISALNGGDDFQLLFTVSLEDNKKISAIEGITIIGHITGEGDGCNLVLHDGSLTELRAPGWEES